MFETNQIKTPQGDIIGGDNIKILSFGIDNSYVSNSNHPAWGVLGFRTPVKQLLNYFKTGTELWCKLVCTVSTGAGTGRVILQDVKNSNELGLYDLNVLSILWQSDTIVRIQYAASTNLSSVSVGEYLTLYGSTNASNDGSHLITNVDDDNDFIDVNIAARTDATDDEATSPSTGETGSVTQFTNTTDNTIISNEFKLTEDTFYKLKINKNSGAGSYIEAAHLIIFSK